MRIVIEKFYDNAGVEIDELVIESDELSFKVARYGNSFDGKGKRNVINIKYFNTEGGALRELLRMKLKESDVVTIEALLDRLVDITQYIKDKTALVVANRESR